MTCSKFGAGVHDKDDCHSSSQTEDSQRHRQSQRRNLHRIVGIESPIRVVHELCEWKRKVERHSRCEPVYYDDLSVQAPGRKAALRIDADVLEFALYAEWTCRSGVRNRGRHRNFGPVDREIPAGCLPSGECYAVPSCLNSHVPQGCIEKVDVFSVRRIAGIARTEVVHVSLPVPHLARGGQPARWFRMCLWRPGEGARCEGASAERTCVSEHVSTRELRLRTGAVYEHG